MDCLSIYQIVNIMDQNFISDITRYLFETTSDNINAVAYGYKFKGGKITDELGLIFSVNKKIPVEELDDSEIIPKVLNFSGVIFDTDVIEQQFKKIVDCPSDFYDWQNPSYVVPNRLEVRPLKGGVSTTNWTDMSDVVGTLGLIAVDNDTNSLVALSNSHVWVKNAFIDSDRNPSDTPSNSLSDVVVQPHPSDGGVYNPIGVVKRYNPLTVNGYNYADVSLSTVNSDDVNLSISYQQLGFTDWTGPLVFATSTEIDNLLINKNQLFSAGRTTGTKGEGDMKLFCSAINSYSIVGEYDNGSTKENIDFGRSIQFVASSTTTPNGYICPYPIAAGDSGSALLADIGGIRKVVGICFAGNEYIGLANRIDDIVNLMNIRAFTGQTSVNFSNNNQPETLYTNVSSDKPYIDTEGKRFWQVGMSLRPEPPATPNPTPTITPSPSPTMFYCGQGFTTGSYAYYDCCGNLKTGIGSGLSVILDYSKTNTGVYKLYVSASQVCPTPTPTKTPQPTPSNTPTSSVTPTPTPTITQTPTSTFYPLPTPVYTAVNECNVFTLLDMGISCYTITQPSSSSSFDGVLKINVTGGTSPFKFLWSGGQRTQTLYGVPPGSYPVTVVDYYGDYTASTVCNLVPITPTPSVTPTFTPTPSPTRTCESLCLLAVGGPTAYGPWQFVCNGSSNGRQVWTYNSQYNIVWNSTRNRWEVVGNDLVTPITFGNGAIMASSNQGQIPTSGWSFLGTETSRYAFTVVQGTCSTSLPLFSSVSIQNTNCSGTQNCVGAITFSAMYGAPPYQYSINNGSTYSTSSVFNNLCAGVYQTIVRDVSGATVNKPVTIGANSNSVSYTISVVSLGSLITTVSQNESYQQSQFAVQVSPAIPVGTSISFVLYVNYQIQNMGPWFNNNPDATAEFDIQATLTKNGSPVSLNTAPTTETTTNRPGCSPSQMEITSGGFSVSLTMTNNDVITGTTYVGLTELSPVVLNGCVSTIESTISINTASSQISGCYCCSVVNNTQPIIYTLTEVGANYGT